MQKYVIYMLLNSDVGQLYVKDKQKKIIEKNIRLIIITGKGCGVTGRRCSKLISF